MKISVRHERVGSPGSGHGIRIAHLSDFHLWFSVRKLHQVEQLLAEWNPDVLALTGDYADTPRGRLLAAHWIEKMAAVYPLCWIAGNHDRWWGNSFVRKLETSLHAHSIDRRDAWVCMRSGARCRFTSWDRATGTVRDALQPAAELVVVMLHNPAVIQPEKLQGRTNCLILAGHLHGGQITLWRDRSGRPQPAAMCYKWLNDRSTVETVPLIVSRGLGDTLPVRFRADKEIVIVDFFART